MVFKDFICSNEIFELNFTFPYKMRGQSLPFDYWVSVYRNFRFLAFFERFLAFFVGRRPAQIDYQGFS